MMNKNFEPIILCCFNSLNLQLNFTFTFKLNFTFTTESVVKNSPSMQETRVPSLGQEDPLEKEMATHSNIFAWIIPWTEESAGYSPWGRKQVSLTGVSD